MDRSSVGSICASRVSIWSIDPRLPRAGIDLVPLRLELSRLLQRDGTDLIPL